jgi:diguanylate cyclase (GGDEF)-like protein
MSFEKISDSELHKLLSIYDVYKQERLEDETPFLQLLTWIEQKQSPQTIMERICQPGEIIIRENDPGDIFYLIRYGQTVVIKGDFQNPAILGFRSIGEAIGEMALLENLPRSATVIALDTVSLWSLSRETFYHFLSENPSFSISLMNVLSGRIRKSEEERMRGFAREKEQVVVLETLSKQVTHDPLTGLFNRRYLDQILYGEITHALQSGSLVSILMADVDHFKQINDRYGHKAGDLMLQSLGELMKSCVRTADIVCRYGGEEFVIIMPGASEQAVRKRAEEIRSKFQEQCLVFDDQEIHATISLGAAIFPLHGSNVDEVFVHADRAMYRAKQEGRNRVVVFSVESGAETEASTTSPSPDSCRRH